MSDPIVPSPRRAEPEPRRSPWRLVGVLIALALVVGVAVWTFSRQDSTTVVPTPSVSPVTQTPSETPLTSESAEPASTPPTAPTPSPSPSAVPAMLEGCEPVDAEGFVPTRYQFENPTADERVLALGLDSDGAIAAPPPNEPRTASWWNQGPRPGSDRGKVVMSIHTYRNGGALGNEMYDGGSSQLQPGDLITLTDDSGRKACYEFVEAKKVWVDDYDPDSDVMVDFDGDPMLAIVICWDFDWSTEIWESRIFFYAKPVSL